MTAPAVFSDFGWATDAGLVRDKNEDSLVVSSALGLAAVADGMGGHNAGELASRTAVETLKSALEDIESGHRAYKNIFSLSDTGCRLMSAIRAANSRILQLAQTNPDFNGMGTTMSAFLLREGHAAIAHVGDSRVYTIHDGRLEQRTQDHSLVMDQVRRGEMSVAEAKSSSMRNVITRALGLEENMPVDVFDISVASGDMVLICSDGLFRVVEEGEILSAALKTENMQTLCAGLVALANRRGGPDNVSVSAMKIGVSAELGVAGSLISALKSFFFFRRKN